MMHTEFGRKLDTLGRLVIPSKLREQLGIITGDIYDFYIHDENDETYLCIKCPKKNPEIEKAKELLRSAGYQV